MQNMKAKNRNMGLDFLKFLCAFLVICIHTDFPGQAYVDALARIAVPVFFMITGFYYTDTQSRNNRKGQIRKIWNITLLANLLYLLWELCSQWLISGSVTKSLSQWCDWQVWLRFVVFNESPFCSRLWYLGALLYVLILAALAEKAGILRKLYFLIPVLLAGNLVLGNFSAGIFGEALPLVYSRNFLLIGLPCFLLGDWLRHYRQKLSCGSVWLAVIFVTACVGALLERELLAGIYEVYNKDFYFSTIFAAIALFLLVNDHAELFHSGVLSQIAVWGRELSLGIYIYNKIVRDVLYKVLDILTRKLPAVEAILELCSPVIVLVATALVVACMNLIKRKLKRK